MKNLSKIVLIAIMSAIIYTAPSFAIVLDKDYLQSKISEDLNNKYKEKNPDGAIVVKNVPEVSVDLKGSTLTIDTICDFSTQGKTKIAKVILTENGITLRTIAVPIEIISYDSVLVATKDISRGETLTSLNTRFEKRNIKNNIGNIIAENYDYSNLSSKKIFKAGEVLDKRYLVKQTAVYRSNPVTAIFQSGAIRLSLEVIALENGGIGDYIKVKSKEYNKIYQGKIINSNQVLIQIWGI